MKSFLVLATMVLSQVSFASGDSEVVYLSWCEDNQVVYTDSNNETKVLADCDLEEKTCTQSHRMTSDYITVFGNCK